MRPQIKPEQKCRFISAQKDCYGKLTQAIPLPKTTAPHVAVVVHENWIVQYDILNTIMTDNGPQLASKYIAALYASIRKNN